MSVLSANLVQIEKHIYNLARETLPKISVLRLLNENRYRTTSSQRR